MRTLIFIAILSTMAFSVNKATKPYTFTPHTTASADHVNKNFDSNYVPLNKLIDTVNNNIPRKSTMFQGLKSGDTLIDTLKVNKIRSNPDIDSMQNVKSIKGKVAMDTAILDSTYSRVSKTNRNHADTTLSDTTYSRAIRTTALNVAGLANASNVLTNYIQFGSTSGSKDSVYIDTTFNDSLFDDVTYRAYTAEARIIQNGNVVTLLQPGMTGTASGGSFSIKGIPDKFKQPIAGGLTQHFSVPIINAGTVETGIVIAGIAPNSFSIRNSAYGFLTAGTSGFYGFAITWIK